MDELRRVSLSEFLASNNWNLESIKHFLEEDRSSINEADYLDRTPLYIVLKNEKCSSEILRLLFRYGANINFQGKISALCIAFESGSSKDVIELLLKAGCSLQACMKHKSVWHCLFNWGKYFTSGTAADVIKLIIEAGADLNRVDEGGRSPLCLAIHNGATVQDIELMLSKGCSMDDCKKHSSPLFCATDGVSYRLLKADVVKFLLNKGFSVEEVDSIGFTPLQNALHYCLYENAAIIILLDQVSEDIANIWHEWAGNLLHLAVNNKHCTKEIVNILLKKGVRSDILGLCEKSPLHLAILRQGRQEKEIGIIKVLLKNGAPVNMKCKCGDTALKLAVENKMNIRVLNVLFAAGAKINASTDMVSLLEMVLSQCQHSNQSYLDHYKKLSKCQHFNQTDLDDYLILLKRQLFNPTDLDRYKILLKHHLLEDSNFNFQGIIQNYYDYEVLSNFAAECINELTIMKYKNIGQGHTLNEFVCGYFPHSIAYNYEPDVSCFDLGLLLKAIVNNAFPIFFDIILAKLGKLLIKKKLQEVFTIAVHYPEYKIVAMDCDCVRKITKFLDINDKLCLILAFSQTCDDTNNV